LVILRNSTAPVYRSNNIYVNFLGLSDMSGNVYQSCSDGPIGIGDCYIKGGTWDNINGQLDNVFRCATRNPASRSNANAYTGFRVYFG
jgi:formylglycine-generating enzyme required for sulfatase activity